MALTSREERKLRKIAAQLIAEDPILSRDLADHGRGSVNAERIPGRWDAWPIALLAVCLAVFAVTLTLTTTF
ncbi:DUF3040 domain-containing protein [Nonomuraea sp. NPDC050663]|uniref:DUF3040 domain-containing protein n=1 Tax=Nonomuraea sp. NPDC050663 TaxID=3364370 RepID=UPI003795282C